MTAAVNLNASEKRKVVDTLVLQFLNRAGIAHTTEDTATGITIKIDYDQNIVLPQHLARLAQ